MPANYTENGVQLTAKRLGCPAAAVRAIIDVESGGAGFLADGRPKILFEAHLFSRLTGRKYDASHPTISSKTWNRGLYIGGAGEWPRFYHALQVDADAAQKSCSWGLFQILGSNWELCGEKSLAGFIHAAYHNEDAHLGLFTEFVINRGLAAALRRQDWAEFARGYNGPAYAQNKYDERLKTAFIRHERGAA